MKPEPEQEYTPTWDETKLSRTKYAELMAQWITNQTAIKSYMEVQEGIKAQLAALQKKYKVQAVRVDEYVARWVPEGKPGRKLVPEKLLSAGVSTKQLEAGYEETKPRAAYFAIFPPKSKGEE